MDEPESVTKLVHDLLHRSIEQEPVICWKSVVVGVKSHHRHHGPGPPELRLPENERQDRNEQVHIGDPDDMPCAGGTMSEHFREQQCRVVLLTIRSVKTSKVHFQGVHSDEAVRGGPNPPSQVLRPCWPEVVQERQEDVFPHPD